MEEEEKGEELEQEERDEELQPESKEDDINRKSWELSPQQKVEIQRGQQQLAQEYNERQANPQPEIPQQSVGDIEIDM